MRSKSKRTYRQAIKAVDFFCGAGGVTRGLLDAGIDVICGIDNDPTVKTTYQENNIRKNGAKVTFLEKDINDLSFDELEKIVKEEKACNLMFVGCAPCQAFTKINTIKDRRENEKNYLLRLGNFVEYFQPEFLFIENVPGITAPKYGGILGRFEERLKELGYYFSDRNINAKKYGIPQNRNRRILVASSERPITFPEETHGNGKKEYITARDVLAKHKLRPLKAGETYPNDTMHRAANLSPTNLWRIRHTPKDGGGREKWMKKKPVKCFTVHINSYTDVYNRMYWDKPVPTITTRFNSLSNGRFGHPDEDRAISLREGALFQTFPIDYKFDGSMVSIARHIGNAVPVELAKTFGLHFLRIANEKVTINSEKS